VALADKENRSVVLLTDGAPNCGASDIDGHRRMIRAHNTQGATINVFGIAASGTYRSFCQNVATDSGGSYFDVP
jgi:Mg-chelatase subunit ChlD